MKYIEYGKENSEVIVLLHGGGLSWWNYQEVAAHLSGYRVILPILDGHAQSDRDFTSIEDTAEEIISLIREQFNGQVLLMGGLSLGGQILLEILARQKDICQYALIESALVVPSKVTYALIKPAFGSCYGLIRHRWFSRLQFQSLRIKPELFEAYYRDTCAITKQNLIAFMQANASYAIKETIADSAAGILVVVGEKENGAMRKSADIIHHKCKGSRLRILPGLYHGELSLNHAADYAGMILQMISGTEA